MALVQAFGGSLLLIGGKPSGNAISFKPTMNTVGAVIKYWGRVNEITYSFDAKDVVSAIIVAPTVDAVFIDAKVAVPARRLSPEQFSASNTPWPTVTLPTLKGYHAGTEIVIRVDQIAYVVPFVTTPTPQTVPPTYNHNTQLVLTNGNAFYVAKEWHEVVALLGEKGWGKDLVARYTYPL